MRKKEKEVYECILKLFLEVIQYLPPKTGTLWHEKYICDNYAAIEEFEISDEKW